jgi:hypothetical protein
VRLSLQFLLIAALSVSSTPAQDARGSISGTVLDPQDLPVPTASVVVRNLETNVTQHARVNAAGYFEANLLNPGQYSVTAEAAGFRSAIRSGLQLNVAGRIEISLRLQIGPVAEAVEVTEAAPLLETTSASSGRVIERRQIMELPLSDMNPFTLAALSPGMQWTGNPGFRRPSDNGGSSSYNTAGGVGQNEYTIDGAPVTGTSRRVAFVPPPDSVEEFKLETNSFDASYGHTSGATVNAVTKSGGNTPHGSLYDQHWQQRWNATSHFPRLAFDDAVRQGKRSASDEKQATGRSNFFGAAFGGPVWIPKLFDGRNKLFFFITYNGHYESKWDSDSPNRTVPKMAWRSGDFSDLLAVDASRYAVYDPRSARRDGARVVRTPFPQNKGVPVLSPIYKFYESLYPHPNDVPGLVSAEGFNNYLASQTQDLLEFNAIVNRIDYNIDSRRRLSGRWQWNDRYPTTRDWAYETQPGLLATGSHRINKGGGANLMWTLSSTSILDLGVNAHQFAEGSRNKVRTNTKPSDVGLPAYLDAKAGDYTMMPGIQFSNLESISFTYPSMSGVGTTGELRASLTTVLRSHTLRYGWNERRYSFASSSPGNTSGVFRFDNQFTRASDDTRTAATHGLEWAAFMMGLPSSISIDTNDSGYFTTRYRALFLQDDWRLTSRLRLNLGLRYERETGVSERFNRALSGEFLADAELPFAAAATAAYAASPLAELSAAQFQVRGGTSYLSSSNRTFTDGTHRLLPRAGAVYQIDPRTVVRGGYGWFMDTFNSNNTQPSQYGFSLPTTTNVTTDNGLSFIVAGAAGNLTASRNPMTDPFPTLADGTRFRAPYRDTLGVSARAGQSQGFYARDYAPAFQQRWRIGVQRQLAGDIVIEASYNGAFARIPVDQPINYVPAQYWATGNTRVQAVDDDLNRNVANPFFIRNLAGLQASQPALYDYLSSQSFFASSTIRKNQLLRPYPQMLDLTGVRPGQSFADTRGRNRYHDLQLQFERRFSKGFHTAVMYTYATGEVSDVYSNQFDAEPSWRPNNQIRPHRFVWTAIWELPFGRNRAWVRQGPLQHIVGGWQLSWVYQYQSGPATDWGNRFFYGDLDNIAALFRNDEVHASDIHLWFDPNLSYRGAGAVPSGFEGFDGRSASQPGQFHTRVFPTRLDSLRADGIRNWDVKILRSFRIAEQLRVNFSVDLLNATNHTNFTAPNVDPTNRDFGRVTAQNGLSRRLQFNLRVQF